jgi:microcystin-dependent protein
MLSKSNILGIIHSLERKNGLSSSIDDNNIDLGRTATNIFIQENTVIEGPLTGISSLYISGITTLQGATTILSSLNVSGVSTLQGATTILSSLNVSGVTTINNTLNAMEVKQQYATSPISFALLVPTGSIMSFAGSSAPYGWLLCDGSEISRFLYATLFNVIATNYGVGNGSTTFNVPNIKGRVPVGRDVSQSEFDTLGETGGENTHTLTTGEMPSHAHTITDPGHVHTYVNNINDQNTDNAFGTETAADNADLNRTTGSSLTGITINATGGGGAHNNLQPYIVLNYIIKF